MISSLNTMIHPQIKQLIITNNIIMIHFTKYAHNTLLRLTGRLSLNQFAFGVIKFNLPDLGEKIKEGTIKKLYVKQGDSVEEFQKLADVASDKQFTEITASDSGVIRKIHYNEEDVCQVGDLFLQIFTNDQPPSSSKITSENNESIAEIKAPQSDNKKESPRIAGSEVMMTPYVRGLIKKYGLNATKITGTGEGGRILEIDVQSFINGQEQVPAPESKPKQQKPISKVQEPTSLKSSSPIPKQTSQKHQPKPSQQPAPPQNSSQVQNIVMSGFEKGMQKSMTESNTIPHLYLHEQFDLTEVQKMRKSLKQSNKKVTVMGILIKTFSLALKYYPKMNALYHPDVNPYEYSIHPSHNISIAIDSPNGLVVPHIKAVNKLNLGDIQNELERLRVLAKEAKLTAKQLLGGTVCLSNIGTIGGTHACPLILPPQVCIVAIGKLQSVPKYKGGQLVERKTINISFGCDHRVVDGATVARFSNHWKQLIENPYLAIADLI